MNYVELHIGDYETATSHLTACEDGVYGRLLRRYYNTEAPLIGDVKELQRLVRARDRDEKAAVESILREFFILASDGCWHHVRCDEELARYQVKQAAALEEKAHETERKRVYRERRASLFTQLRALGIVPPYNAKTDELEALLSRGTTAGRDADGTANQSPDTRPKAIDQELYPSTQSSTGGLELEKPADPPRAHVPGAAGAACLLMRKAGCLQTNPGNPNLLAAIAEGISGETLAQYATLAVKTGKSNPFAYAIAAARGDRAQSLLDPSLKVPATSGAAHGTNRKLSAVDRVEANVRRARIARGENPDQDARAIDGTAVRVTR